MTDNHTLEAERFYRERDSRTIDYLDGNSPALVPVSIHASADACTTHAGQLLLTTLVNQLSRIHRQMFFALAEPDADLLTLALCGGSNIGDEMCRLAKRIDPYGKFELACQQLPPSKISVGVGASCRPDLTWYLGCNRSNAQLAPTPCKLGENTSSDLRGASLAALLGAAAVTKSALDIANAPITLSAWNFRSGQEADPGPEELPNIDVGHGLMVGAGAVGASTVYWLMQWGNMSPWTIIDRDVVELHNTNRSLLFFPDDAGWPDKQPDLKVECLCRCISGAVPIPAWYDEATEAKQSFDTVLVLANERDVRTRVSSRNDPIQLQATTGRSWLSQLHRHISGYDDCIRCRMSDVRAPRLACSTAPVAADNQSERPDAALPFLSAASGLMLVSMLQHLQLGDFGTDKINMWNWDFYGTPYIHKSGCCICRTDCSTTLPSDARRVIAKKTRWANAKWAKASAVHDYCQQS